MEHAVSVDLDLPRGTQRAIFGIYADDLLLAVARQGGWGRIRPASVGREHAHARRRPRQPDLELGAARSPPVRPGSEKADALEHIVLPQQVPECAADMQGDQE